MLQEASQAYSTLREIPTILWPTAITDHGTKGDRQQKKKREVSNVDT